MTCALITWSCQTLHCCCYCLWILSLSWNEGDEARFCTRGSSLLLAGFLHQNHYLANLRREREREREREHESESESVVSVVSVV